MPTQQDVADDSPTVDREHQVQMRLMQAVTQAIAAGEDPTDLLAQLGHYTQAHFLGEELLMRLHAYLDFDDHADDHARMIEWLEQLSARRGDRQAMAEAARELSTILERHIATRDRALHEFLSGL